MPQRDDARSPSEARALRDRAELQQRIARDDEQIPRRSAAGTRRP
jgi:hypothetical protein